MRETKRISMHFRKKKKKNPSFLCMHFQEEGESLDTTCSRRKKNHLGFFPFPFCIEHVGVWAGGRATPFAKRRRRKKKKIFAHGDTSQNFRVSAWTLTPSPASL